MRKTVLYIAMSLDGYIADENNNVDWLNGQDPDSDDMRTYFDFEKTVDTVIMGYTTYDQIVNELSVEKWPYPTLQGYVLTHKVMKDNDQVKFINKNAKELLEEIKKNTGKDIWICGGSDVVNQFAKHNLIDEYWISIIPIILGEGVRLFNNQTKEIKLHLVNTNIHNGITELIYRRRQHHNTIYFFLLLMYILYDSS